MPENDHRGASAADARIAALRRSLEGVDERLTEILGALDTFVQRVGPDDEHPRATPTAQDDVPQDERRAARQRVG